MTNIDSAGLGEHCSELHLYHADNLFTDSWTPLKQNPVIFDAVRARNGGLIVEGERIYRVFQVHSKGFYGKSFGVAEIKQMSESEYSEEIQFCVEPRFFGKIEGIHTYNFTDGVLVFDYCSVD